MNWPCVIGLVLACAILWAIGEWLTGKGKPRGLFQDDLDEARKQPEETPEARAERLSKAREEIYQSAFEEALHEKDLPAATEVKDCVRGHQPILGELMPRVPASHMDTVDWLFTAHLEGAAAGRAERKRREPHQFDLFVGAPVEVAPTI